MLIAISRFRVRFGRCLGDGGDEVSTQHGGGGEHTAHHCASHSAGDDILPSEIQAGEGSLRSQPVLAEAAWRVIESVDLAMLLIAKVLRREWSREFAEVHFPTDLRDLSIEEFEQSVRQALLERGVFCGPFVPLGAVPSGKSFERNEGEDVDRRFSGTAVLEIGIFRGGKRDVDDANVLGVGKSISETAVDVFVGIDPEIVFRKSQFGGSSIESDIQTQVSH